MTLVTFKNKPFERNFNNAMDTFFNAYPSLIKGDLTTTHFKPLAPVNVKEVENGYQLDLVAPGFDKEDFKVALDKNLLTISVEKKSEEETKNEKVLRQEYKYRSFKRSFTLDENIDAENIDVKYVNGVLSFTLPKRADVKPATKQISVQ